MKPNHSRLAPPLEVCGLRCFPCASRLHSAAIWATNALPSMRSTLQCPKLPVPLDEINLPVPDIARNADARRCAPCHPTPRAARRPWSPGTLYGLHSARRIANPEHRGSQNTHRARKPRSCASGTLDTPVIPVVEWLGYSF